MKHPSLFTLLLITATIGIANAAGPPDDAALTAALIGAWEVMESPSAVPYGEVIYTADGHLHGFNTGVDWLPDGSTRKVKVKMRGDWAIKRGVLVITNLESDRVDLIPRVALKRYLIKSISTSEAHFKDLSDGASLYRRRKRSIRDVKV